MSTLIIAFLQGLIVEYPAIIELFQKGEPTENDWVELERKIKAKSYSDYVPDSQIPKDQ